MTQKQICNILEIVRWLCIIAGFNLAYFSSQDPAGQLHIIMPWLVIPLAGLTGIESVFLGKTASELSGYGYNPAYQRQSGMNNIAVAITAIVVSFFEWGTHAEIAVFMIMLIFLTLSACNHAYSAIKDKNYALKNLMRPLMTALLLAFTIPFIIKALN